MIKMAEAASQQALVEGKRKLREFLEASDTGRQAIAMSGRDEGYEMGRMNGGGGKVASVEEEDVDDI
jgi:hypothetical protein